MKALLSLCMVAQVACFSWYSVGAAGAAGDEMSSLDRVSKALAANQRGDIDGAIKIAEPLGHKHIMLPTLYVAKADKLQAQHQLESAQQFYKKAIADFEQIPHAEGRLAQACSKYATLLTAMNKKDLAQSMRTKAESSKKVHDLDPTSPENQEKKLEQAKSSSK